MEVKLDVARVLKIRTLHRAKILRSADPAYASDALRARGDGLDSICSSIYSGTKSVGLYPYARSDAPTYRLIFWVLLNNDGMREMRFERVLPS